MGVLESADIAFLSLQEAAAQLDVSPGRLHRLLEESRLLAVSVAGKQQIPAVMIRDGEPLPAIRGTLLLLSDLGFSAQESLEWLFTLEESIGQAPIEALLAGRKAEVRRVAQALG